MRTARALLVLAVFVCAGWMNASRAADFPRWRGAEGGGSAGETSVPLVDNWEEVKIAWVSEVKSPHAWDFSVVRAKTNWPRTVLGSGGYCMPVVADGKVYVSIWRPSGTITATKGDGKYENMWATSGRTSLSLIDADQVIVCMDARTGMTLWEAVFEGTELNEVEAYGGHNNACVANGKVYAIGCTGRAYGVDAKTGAKLWCSKIGKSADVWDRFKAHCLKERLKSYSPPESFVKDPGPPHPLGGSLHSQTYNVCPVVADGVMITGDWAAGSALVGFDGETGQQLWQRSGVGGGINPPLLWRHGGKEYAIVASGAVQCLEPRTGKTVWSAGPVAYGQTQVGIAGDYLVCRGMRPKDAPADVLDPGWVCYKMSPDKAERVWALGPKYPGSGYLAPTLHRGHVWLYCTRGAADADPSNCDGPDSRGVFVCADLASGKVLSSVGGMPVNPVCPGPLAMGDRMFYQGDMNIWMASLDAQKPAYIGNAPQPTNYCSSATAADGFVYFRGAERLVGCLDVRKPEHRPKPSERRDDPANAFYELTLTGARADGQDVGFFFRGRNGKFTQAWSQTLGPKYRYPDVLEAEGLQVKDGALSGSVRAYIESKKYEYRLDGTLSKEGVVTGAYEDTYRGVPIEGAITGTVRPHPKRNAKFVISWPRSWCGGGDVSADFKMFVDMNDGQFSNVVFQPRIAGAYQITVEKIGLAFDGERLTGDLVLQQAKFSAGRYTITFNVTPSLTRMRGRVQVQKEGQAARDMEAWGEVQVPATEPCDPANANYTLWLDKSVPDTGGLTLFAGTKDARGVEGAQAWVRACIGLHPADATGLRVEGKRITGQVTATVSGDGYLLKNKNIPCAYQIDAEVVEGGEMRGTVKGVFDKRDARRGEFTGTFRNE